LEVYNFFKEERKDLFHTVDQESHCYSMKAKNKIVLSIWNNILLLLIFFLIIFDFPSNKQEEDKEKRYLCQIDYMASTLLELQVMIDLAIYIQEIEFLLSFESNSNRDDEEFKNSYSDQTNQQCIDISLLLYSSNLLELRNKNEEKRSQSFYYQMILQQKKDFMKHSINSKGNDDKKTNCCCWNWEFIVIYYFLLFRLY
jgi:hypothetical protein